MLDSLSSFEIAQHVTLYDWDLLNSVHVVSLTPCSILILHILQLDFNTQQDYFNCIYVAYFQIEFVYKVFGSHKFDSATSNIDMFARRFNQLAYWIPTEMCLCQNASKRVQLLRRFIKIAQQYVLYNTQISDHFKTLFNF